jgi:hypothetical protein
LKQDDKIVVVVDNVHSERASGEKTTIKRKNDTVESKPDSLNVFYE